MTLELPQPSTTRRLLFAALAIFGGACETDLGCESIGAIQRGGQCLFPPDASSTSGESGQELPDGGSDAANPGAVRTDDGSADTGEQATDSDMDGVPSGQDNCSRVPNPGQEDLDGDGLGDLCDEDADGDGVLDESDPCPLGLLKGPDSDADGCKDAEDSDIDGDGRINSEDGCPEQPEEIDEVDRDGCPLGIDACPLGLRDGPDADGDGCKDSQDSRPDSADAPGRRLYVDADAPGRGSTRPLGWDDAFPHLATALAAAESLYDTHHEPVEVWVAAGIYRPDEGGVFPNGDREARFVVTRGTRLRGGFRLDEDAGYWVRDAMADTVLSGDLVGDDDPESPEAFKTDNACHVVQVIADDAQPLLEGLRIEGGWAFTGVASSQPCASSNGGGIRVAGGSGGVVFRDLGIVDNGAHYFGGGAYVEDADTIWIDCAFEDNHGRSGGGLYASHTPSHVTSFYAVRLAGNSAERGGGLMADEGVFQFVSTEFQGNSASDFGSALASDEATVRCVHCSVGGNGPGELVHASIDNDGSMHFASSVIHENAGELPPPDSAEEPSPVGSYANTLTDGGEGIAPPYPPPWSPFASPPDPAGAPSSKGDLRLKSATVEGLTDASTEWSCPDRLTGSWAATTPGVSDLCDDQDNALFDLAGQPRVQGDAPDLGAYENADP